jgi:acyl-CoA synthetase (AMP-forming)/AMP-acid ligase II
VQNFAYGLLQAGIRPGDRIAVLAPNSYVPLDFLTLVYDAHQILDL